MDYLASTFIFNNSLENWFISIAIALGSLLVAKILFWISKNIILRLTKKTETKLDDLILANIEGPVALAIVLAGIWFAINRLHLSPKIDGFVNDAYQILIIINVTWAFARVIDAIINEYLLPYSEKRVDDHVVRVLQKTIKVVIWIFGIVVALGNIGINIAAIITGLGIGGIAFALAAQDTIKNIIAGFILFVDRPFRLGERIKIDSYDGFVEDLGLRSVRIRTLDKRLLTVPSSKVVDSVIENITVEPSRRVVLQLGLTYNTNTEQMSLALELLKNLPSLIEDIETEVFAYFTSYGDFALNIKFIYYIKKQADIIETESKVNLKILSLFNENKLNFAYPTTTVYIEK